MAEDVVIRYRAEIDELTGALKKIQVEQKKIAENEDKSNDEIEKSITTQELAAKKRKQLLELERKELQKLIQLRDLAYDPAKISAYNTQISKAQQNIKLLGGETEKSTNKAKTALQSFGAAAALSLGAAFSIDAIIQFGKASVNAFLEAEENANRLKFAITQVGGESEIAFERLIKQSSRLQEITIFSDDSIQQAQAALSAFGLTADQIEELIPKLADFATITSQDIPAAAAQIGAALEGNGREFKKYGIEVTAAASRTENLNAILGGLDKFAGSAEEATTTLTGSLKQAENQADELQEQIGEKLAPAFVKARLAIVSFFASIFGAGSEENKFKQLSVNLKGVVDDIDGVAAAIARNEADLNVFQDIIRELTSGGVSGNRGQRSQEFAKLAESILVASKAAQENLTTTEDLNVAYFTLSGLQTKINEAYKAGTIDSYQQETATKILKEQLEQLGIVYQDNLVKQRAAASAQEEATSRLLTAAELEKKTTKELVSLKEREAEINDKIAKENIKAIDTILKAREEYAKAVEAAEKQLAQLQIDNIEDEKRRRIAAFEQEVSDIKVKGQLRSDIIIELEKQLVKDLNEIDQQRNVDPLFRAQPSSVAVPDQLTNTRNPDSTVLDPEDEGDRAILILQSTSDLLNDLSGLYAVFNQQRLNEIEEQKNAEIEGINASLEANEEALKKGRISQVEAAKVEQELLAAKLAAEKKAAEEERKIKRRQAILDKAAALFQIAINTQKAISEVSPVVPLMALAAAAGAAQAAIVVAQPIPYKKGTKSAKGGLSLVGEEGAELTMLPTGTKVLPAKQTKTHSEAIDAMFDNRFDSFVLDRYVNPALKKAKKEKQKEDNITFAENISKSVTLNQLGLTEKELEKVRRRGQSINNVDELARAISQYTKRDIYR